ncbi:Cytosolic phospholipase A2 [Blattella germanica]|nr:Cytosolic phospholipase A2 [Blattella germanica]
MCETHVTSDSVENGSLCLFAVDTPDPYVVMSVPGTPNGTKRTRTVDNCRNPTWDNTFYFYINPEIQNSLCVSLVDANVLEDSTMGSVMVSLDDIRLNGSKVYLKIYKEESEPKDLRLDLSLCKEEKDFLRIRRLRVLNGMKTFLAEDSPKKVQEVPTVAVLGSGGGIRALVGYYGAFKALQDMQLIDCIMFIAALSGSSWFLSFLYSQPDFPEKGPKEFEAELRDILSESLVKCFSPVNVYRTVSAIVNKRIAGQPISLTDFFGHLLGDLLLRKHKDVKLSDQRRVLDYGRAPLPLYTCINVKHNVSARVFQEWVEFNPYEIGVTKYGTYTKPENFGSKFYLGNIIKKFPEPPLHFLQGIWGSAYSIQFKRLVKEICHMDSSAPERKMEDYDLEEEDFNSGGEFSECEEVDPGQVRIHDSTAKTPEIQRLVHDSDRSDLEDSDAEYISLAWKSFDARTIIQHTLDFITTEIHFEERDRKLQSQFIKERARTKPRRHNPWKEQKKVQRKGKQSNETTLFDAAISSLLSSAAINSSRVLRAGIIHNVMRGLHLQNVFNKSETEGKKLFLVDSGLTFNLPFPLLLRSQRAVDLFLCFDFSERHSDDEQPFDEILLAEKWASKIKIPFPPIKKVVDEMSKDEPLKECYVFEDTENPY